MQHIDPRPKFALFFALLFSVGSGASSCQSMPHEPAATTASLRGRVLLSELPPAPASWELGEVMQVVCGNSVYVDESLLHSADGGLANCVVSLRPVDREVSVVPLDTALFQKVGPRYVPRVLPITIGTEVVLRNANSPCNGFMARTIGMQFNRTVVSGTEFRERFEKRGAVPISCDLRIYMRGAIVVLDTEHYALTDDDGNWSIENVPPGEYELRVWHERMNRRKGKLVTKPRVRAGESLELDYAFELPKASD